LLWATLFFLQAAALLLLSAEINSNYTEFRNLLEDLDNIFTDTVRMKQLYFHLKLGKDFFNKFVKVPRNFLHKKFLDQLQKVASNEG
jgi:hypothetical protein